MLDQGPSDCESECADLLLTRRNPLQTKILRAVANRHFVLVFWRRFVV